jgi:antirestriction protein ArdC
VEKGEKASQIVFYRPLRKIVREDDGSESVESFPLLRTFSVFSIHQVDGGVVEPFLVQPARPIFEDASRAEFDQVVRATKADIRFGGNYALYSRPPQDYVQMPVEGHFHSFPKFAETLAHELSHWTEHRLGWTGSYAAGELRAEMAAVFLVAALNIPESDDLTNHVAYLQSWLEALQNDPKFLFRAAAAASKSADFILSFSRQTDADTDPVEEAA